MLETAACVSSRARRCSRVMAIRCFYSSHNQNDKSKQKMTQSAVVWRRGSAPIKVHCATPPALCFVM
jgi:hypothetical protein